MSLRRKRRSETISFDAETVPCAMGRSWHQSAMNFARKQCHELTMACFQLQFGVEIVS